MKSRLHISAGLGLREMIPVYAGIVFLCGAGCCAVPGPYRADAPFVGPGGCAGGSCGVGRCGACSDGVVVERPGLLSGVFRILGIGPSCGDCGPRYWGDWGGEPANCEACDDYGNWTGGGAAYARPVLSDVPESVESVPRPAPCPHCRQSISQHAVPAAGPTGAALRSSVERGQRHAETSNATVATAARR